MDSSQLGGGEAAEGRGALGRRPRFLCLHGFRTSAEIMRKQVLGKWPSSVTVRLDLVFADAPFPAEGRSVVEGMFDPPYYQWFQVADKNVTEYRHFDEWQAALAHIEDLMIKHGPFDGLMGFSQGLALTRVPKIRYLIIISGAKLESSPVAEKAYANKITCPSLHFIGDNDDFLKAQGEKLIESCVNPIIIRHPKGHTIPRLDGKSLEILLSFLDRFARRHLSIRPWILTKKKSVRDSNF